MTPATSTAPRSRQSAPHDQSAPRGRPRSGVATRTPRSAPPASEVVVVIDLRVADGGSIRPGSSVARTVVESFGGTIAAALGTRLVAVFPGDRVADAVGAAVTIQRRAAATRRRAASGDRRPAPVWNAAVGVTIGPSLRSDGHAGLAVTPVGPAVDLALELCRAGDDASVLADEEVAGRLTRAAPDDGARRPWSLGERCVVVADGRPAVTGRQVTYATRGRDPRPSQAGGATVDRRDGSGSGSGARPGAPAARSRRGEPPAPSDSTPDREGSGAGADPVRRRAWSAGRVCCWFDDRGRGVIASRTGQEFYVDRRFLVASGDLATDQTVYFVPRDPVSRGRNPVAGAVLVAGAQIEARVEHVDERGFGFAQMDDGNGTSQLLLVDLTRTPPVSRGDWLLVRVDEGKRGPVARPT